ncbi:MAG: septal ring lytic transglycosylase RlpA family protein [Leptolyngbya sp. SIOISBB]|nr:septal ring lytic transglycosylase RlpA family protein [Leptolyngbya sp. SIOISBB]
MTAVHWVNNLRTALNAAPMSLADIQMVLTGLTETSETLYGTASWYGPYFHGRQTANGEIFDENALTAAHKTLPFNTQLKVTNRMNGQSVVVRINDRGPYVGQRSLDLSKAAAHCLGSAQNGVVPYEAVILKPASPTDLDELTTAQLPLE